MLCSRAVSAAIYRECFARISLPIRKHRHIEAIKCITHHVLQVCVEYLLRRCVLAVNLIELKRFACGRSCPLLDRSPIRNNPWFSFAAQHKLLPF